uniref:MTP_lip_bd domain-containing protein n=1 Tax=Haemonchus contortus TaxID=6289 RepID=A0A7I4YIK6_HAECO|nr:CRE-DSC-4 protein [Haemonchus contortus]
MSAVSHLIYLCFFSVLLTGLGADSLNAKKDIHKTAPVANEEMARLIKVDYSFESESVLYDVVDNKVKTPSTYVAGNFTFESLHHDIEGGMLGRYRLTVCKTGNCGNVPDVYVSFVQGGNNIQEVLYDAKQYPNEKPRWNFIYAIINTIYTPAENGEGDDQYVDTIYGKCQVQFGRPEDKRFRRKINNCKIKGDVNFTRIDGIQPVLYEQDVSYLQNTKIDADIVVIDAIELLRFGALLHNKWGFTLESRTHVEITNRTMNYVARHCNSQTQTAAVCASEKFGAVSVGKKLYERVVLGRKEKKNELADLVAKYRSHLYDMGDSHTCEEHSKMFAEIVQEGRLASEQDWKAVLMHPENEPVLHALGNVLGALGTSQSLKIAREVLLVEGPDFLDDYLFGAAHTTSSDEKWHKQLMYWLKSVKEEEETYWKVANILATVLRKRCDRTPSTRNSCHLGKERIVTKFISNITACQTEECNLKSLEVLQNIPISASFEIARGFLCTPTHSAPVQMAALQLIKAASPTLYDSKLANVLIRLFRNVCPQPTSTGESQLAIDILVKCLPEQQHVATMLLRTETLNPDDHEKWQYFYKAVESSGHRDELKEEVWHQMRKFKVFRPNYAHRALKADSHAHWHEITDIDGYRLHSTSEVEFDSGVFRRSEFDIGLRHGKVDESLFKLSTMTAGLDSFVNEGAAPAEPEAKVRLSLLGHALPSMTLFKGTTELMGIVWNADGQTVKALEGNLMLRDTTTELPLLSGLTVDVSASGALSFKVLTSASISILSQETQADLRTNISMSLISRATLLHHGEPVHTLNSDVSVLTTVGSEADVRFSEIPFGFCITMQREAAKLSFASVSEAAKKPRKKTTVTGSKVYPGVTYKLDDNITKQCSLLFRKDMEQV